jgi:hypothetical protein
MMLTRPGSRQPVLVPPESCFRIPEAANRFNHGMHGTKHGKNARNDQRTTTVCVLSVHSVVPPETFFPNTRAANRFDHGMHGTKHGKNARNDQRTTNNEQRTMTNDQRPTTNDH